MFFGRDVMRDEDVKRVLLQLLKNQTHMMGSLDNLAHQDPCGLDKPPYQVLRSLELWSATHKLIRILENKT